MEREYLSMVAKKSFIITTLLMPVIVIVIGALPVLVNKLGSSSTTSRQTVAVIDETGQFKDAVKSNELYEIMPLKSQPGKTDGAKFLRQSGGSLDAVVVIPADVRTSNQVSLYSEETVNVSLTDLISNALSDTLTAVNMAALGVSRRQLDAATADVVVKSMKLDSGGSASDTSSEMAMIVGMVLSLVIYGFVLSYGGLIMSSVIEEKTNRIVEVIVSSCKPFELMMGKIVGIGLVGLTQFAIWAILICAGGSVLSAFMPSAGAEAASGMEMAASVTNEVIVTFLSINLPRILLCFVVYFIGGYLLYSSLFAGLGSAVDQANDASQFMTPMMLIMIVALYVGIGCMTNPNSSMAVWCSIIPFTSPIVMMVRLPFNVPAWQMLLSIVLLFAAAVGCVWISGRIYRNGILRYGKKFTWRDIIAWMR